MANKFLSNINLSLNKAINVANGTVNNDAVNKWQLDAQISAVVGSLSSALQYKGNFDASAGNYAALAGASQGDFYVVSVDGTIGSIEYKAGDHIVVNKDVAGTPVVADIDLIKNTEFTDAVYVDAIQTLLSKTIDADFNIITSIVLAQLKAGVLNTDLTTLEAFDTEIPSAKAVQDLVSQDVAELKTKISNLTFIYDVIGNDLTSDFVVNHNLNSTTPIVRVINSTTKAMVFADVELTDANNVTVRFSPVPATGEDYKVIVLGTSLLLEPEAPVESPEEWFVFDGIYITEFNSDYAQEIANAETIFFPTKINGVWVDSIAMYYYDTELGNEMPTIIIPNTISNVEFIVNSLYLSEINSPGTWIYNSANEVWEKQ